MGSGRKELTNWEVDFLSGISGAVKQGKYLTGRQKELAKGILKEKQKNTHSTVR